MTNREERRNPGRRGHAARCALAALVALGGLSSAGFAAAEASSRDATIAQLRALETAWPGSGVSVAVLREGVVTSDPVRIGDELAYRFGSEVAGYLTAIHVDIHGAATLLYPREDPEAGRVGADRIVSLPGESDGFTLQAQPPVGRDVVYAIVTKRPVRRDELGITSRDVVVSFEPHEAPAFVRRVRAALDARARSEVEVAHVVQEIAGRGEVQYRSADIVGFFGERTRSIRPAKLDLQIPLRDRQRRAGRSGSSQHRRVRPRPSTIRSLRPMRFKVAGHTDDRGSESHNLDLSRRRAEAVRGYLVELGRRSAAASKSRRTARTRR